MPENIRSAVKTAYHVNDGPTSMYLIDARSAVARFPKDWSFSPWRKDGEKSVPIIDISEGWQDMKPSERINLAVRLGAKRPGLTLAKADEFIEAEVERRANEPAPEPEPEPEPEFRSEPEPEDRDRERKFGADKPGPRIGPMSKPGRPDNDLAD